MPIMIRTLCTILAFVHATTLTAADSQPFPVPPYFALDRAASDQPGELGVAATYTLWIPEGVRTLRGVIVHQHGCGISSGKAALTAAYDLHWQSLARKWDCALIGPAYHLKSDKDCRKWCDPRNGSDTAFQQALAHFARETNHPELTTVPWALWGHSGGAFWSSLMLTLHPHRIAAIFYRSGSAYRVWESGEIPRPNLTPAVYQVPFMFIGGDKEEGMKSHGPARVGDRAMLKAWREQGAPGGLARDPISGHDCGDSRYLAIPFFDSCLAMRLPDVGSKESNLKPVDWGRAWLATPGTDLALPAAEFKGDAKTAHWLPDAAFAKAWVTYNTTGRPFDTTPPPSPQHVQLDVSGALSWISVADFESGLASFIIVRDGKELATLPEKPLGKIGTPLFQGLTGGDTPITAQPPMSYTDTAFKPGAAAVYQVISVNASGLRSASVSAVAKK